MKMVTMAITELEWLKINHTDLAFSGSIYLIGQFTVNWVGGQDEMAKINHLLNTKGPAKIER